MKYFRFFNITILLLFACSDSNTAVCDSFNNVEYFKQWTADGIPYGTMVLNVQGCNLRNYSDELPYILYQYDYWKNLYLYECDINGGYDEDLTEYYHELTSYYGGQLILKYKISKNLILEFNGVNDFKIILSSIDPLSSEPDKVLLEITDLTAGDIGMEITLNASSINRKFYLDYGGDIFSSLETGSSLKIIINNIRPAGQITQVEILPGSILFNDAGNLESVSIQGYLNAKRK